MRKLFVLCTLVVGCSSQPQSQIATNEALTSPAFAAASFPDGFEMDSVAGDERVLFTGNISPTAQTPTGVLVADRLTHQPIGQLAQPPGSFHVVSALAVLSYTTSGRGTSGTLLVADAGALPPQSQTTFYRYSYTYSPDCGLTSQLLDAHQMPAQVFPPTSITGIGYPGGVALLPGGVIAVADALDGAIWTCPSTLASCTPGVISPAFGVAPAPPSFSGIGRAPGGGTRPYTLGIASGLMPGLLNIDYTDSTDEVCGLVVAPPGGLYCVQRSVLLANSDPTTKNVRVLVAPQVGVTDGGHGVAFDHWNPSSNWFYWVRSLADTIGGGSNIVRRVNLTTGEVQEVVESLSVMDFSTGLAVIPPLVSGSPLTHLVVAMGQEENNGAINSTLNGVSQFVTPSIIAGAIVSSR